jgi:photosystem II stability/assembly factor-like uncharacterized protein
MWRATGAIVIAATASAYANGRPPATVDIDFRPHADPTVDARPQDVLSGMTWGLVLSRDGGATWRWMCEAAVGYGGIYDPDYEWLPDGAIAATTFEGVRVNRDGCTFEATSLGNKMVTQLALASDNTLFAAASDASDAGIYASSDGGHTFELRSAPAGVGTWWQSLEVAPSNPRRIYASGYIVANDANRPQLGSDSTVRDARDDGKQLLLYRSDDGGATFTKLSSHPFHPYSEYSTLEIAAVSPLDPDLVFVRVTGVRGGLGDVVYRSPDGGATWKQVLYAADSLHAFAARRDGTVVASTATDPGLYRSTDGGQRFESLPADEAYSCFAEDQHGTMWACGQNFGRGAAISRSADLATWTPILRFSEVADPVECPVGTTQHDHCAANWCAIAAQFGIPTFGCKIELGGELPAAPHHPGGCCDGGAGVAALPGAAIAVLALRRRRRAARD